MTSPSPAPGPVGAWLDKVKERHAFVTRPGAALDSGSLHGTQVQLAERDVPALAAALEAVLVLTARWQADPGHPSPQGRTIAEAKDWCATRIREAIETALRDAQGAG